MGAERSRSDGFQTFHAHIGIVAAGVCRLLTPLRQTTDYNKFFYVENFDFQKSNVILAISIKICLTIKNDCHENK